MKNISLKKQIFRNLIYGIITVSILGTLGHFLYEWTGENKIAGLFIAVNESTWEHMKLLFFPMLLYTLFMMLKFRKNAPVVLPAMLISAIIGTLLIPVLFYTYTGILGFMINTVNIAIFYVCVIISFTAAHLIIKKCKLEEINIILYFIITLFICMFFLFTYDPPGLGIFIDPAQQ